MSVSHSIVRLAMHRAKNVTPASLWDAMAEDERRILLTVMQLPEANAAAAFINLSNFIKDKFTKFVKEWT